MESNTTSPAETLKVAVAAYNDGNLFEAEHLCHAILAASPAFVEALSLLANIQARLGHGNDALATYEQVLAVRADDAVVFNNRGVLLQEMKRFDEALASYEKAIALKPDFVDALYNRGIHRTASSTQRVGVGLRPGRPYYRIDSSPQF